METLTDEQLVATRYPSGHVQVSLGGDQHKNRTVVSVATETEERCDGQGAAGETGGKHFSTVNQNSLQGYRQEITDGRKSLRRQKQISESAGTPGNKNTAADNSCDTSNSNTNTLRRRKKYDQLRQKSEKQTATRRAAAAISDSKSSSRSEVKEAKEAKEAKKATAIDSSNEAAKEEKTPQEEKDARLSSSLFDENAEWAEIANIIASFGSFIGSEIDASLNSSLSPKN